MQKTIVLSWAALFSCLLAFAWPVHSAPVSDDFGSFGPVSHVVIGWLKKPGDKASRRKFIEVTRSFATLPGVIDHKLGVLRPPRREVVDASFDVATVITFRNRAALNAYLEHPRHKKAVSEMLKPLIRKIIVYDVELK